MIKQHRLFTGIYVVGTGLSIALVMTLFIIFYVKFAPIYPEYNRNRMLTVTKMKSYPKDNDKSWNCSAVSYDVVKMLQDLPHLEAIGATASNYRENYVEVPDNNEPISVTPLYTDVGFWKVFTFRFLHGKPFTQADIDAKRREVVLPVSVARKLFATDDVVGRRFNMDAQEYRVCGVVEDVSAATPSSVGDMWLPITLNSWVTSDTTGKLVGSVGIYMTAPDAEDKEALKEEVREVFRKLNLASDKYMNDLMGQPDDYWASTFRFDSCSAPDLASELRMYFYMLLALLFIPAMNLSGMMSSRMDERLSEFTVADFNDLLSVQSEMSDKKGYFFLDEVQNIDGWEKFARRMADAKEHIYITGSNAKMLSREIETTLGGRFFARHITPYAFGEYLTACEVPHDEPALLGTKTNGKIRAACAQYLQYGGLPESLLYKAKREYISGVYQKVLLGDIITRNSIRNDYAVKILIKKIAESVRSEISYSKLQKTLRAVNVSLAKDTIADYIRYAEDAYLLFHLQNYYANLVEKESYPKFYFSDNGIVSLFLDRKESVQLENMVAVALTRAYPDDVYYLKSAKTGIDIDFYVPSIGLAVQAAYSIAGDAREREVGSLKKLAQNSQGAARLVIVTYEEEETIIEDGVTIEAVPLYKFLLELENRKYGTAY